MIVGRCRVGRWVGDRQMGGWGAALAVGAGGGVCMEGGVPLAPAASAAHAQAREQTSPRLGPARGSSPVSTGPVGRGATLRAVAACFRCERRALGRLCSARQGGPAKPAPPPHVPAKPAPPLLPAKPAPGPPSCQSPAPRARQGLSAAGAQCRQLRRGDGVGFPGYGRLSRRGHAHLSAGTRGVRSAVGLAPGPARSGRGLPEGDGTERRSALPQAPRYFLHRIPRSREVRQSWLSTVVSTLRSACVSLPLTYRVRPDLVGTPRPPPTRPGLPRSCATRVS